MRAVLVLATVGACGFAPSEGGGGPVDAARDGTTDTRAIDARMIDAPSTSTCVTHSTSMLAGHHYFHTAKEGWFTAQAECLSLGGHLVKVETAEENTFVTGLASGNGYTWIGLSDPTSTDTYVWTDGSALGSYQAFGGSVPTGTPDCVDTNGTWALFNCGSTSHDGICECE